MRPLRGFFASLLLIVVPSVVWAEEGGDEAETSSAEEIAPREVPTEIEFGAENPTPSAVESETAGEPEEGAERRSQRPEDSEVSHDGQEERQPSAKRSSSPRPGKRRASTSTKRRRSGKRRTAVIRDVPEDEALEPPQLDKALQAIEDEGAGPGEGRHWQVGVKGGFISVPAGILHVFVDGGTDKIGGAAGAYFAYQRNLLEISGSIWWADYSYDDEVIFQTAGDRNDPEFVTNDLSLLTINIDFVWAHWFTRWMAATFGTGLGLSVVLGEVRRTEATPPTGPYTDLGEPRVHGYVHCQYDAADPQWTTPFCEAMCTPETVRAGTCPPRTAPSETGDLLGYYDTVEDRIPSVLPWINFLIGLRFLPHEHFQIDIQSGFGLGILFFVRGGYRF